MTDIFAQEGASASEVTTYQNVAGGDNFDPILAVEPERGTALRFLNRVARGRELGIPIYKRLRDSNGDLLPNNTEFALKADAPGMTEPVIVSEVRKTMSFANSNDLSTQRDEEHIDGAKVVLQYPETSGKTGARERLDIQDVDTFYFTIRSAAQVDWSQSALIIDNKAVKEL